MNMITEEPKVLGVPSLGIEAPRVYCSSANKINDPKQSRWKEASSTSASSEENDHETLHRNLDSWKIAAIMTGLSLAILCVALVRHTPTHDPNSNQPAKVSPRTQQSWPQQFPE
jgi:hypothetical protein